MIARVALCAVAVAAAVLLWGRLGSARDLEHATALANGGAANVAAARAQLRDAAAETRDTAPLLRAAQLELFAGRPDAALALAQVATRREPENAQAWLLTAQAAERAGDETAGAAARRHVAALVRSP